ncbi:MAG: glycosyltransferase [Candidatus Hydrogenedentes bacterium]|nr:glycosyltransferase [Candidatus Hydrogenedentota bacterium]
MDSTTPTISAVLIVRDEARHLANCLRALRGVVDEIVVADTGSTDDSVAIAEAAGARVVHFPWCNDFAAARNAALAAASGAYALAIDADEYLDQPESAREKLIAHVAAYDRHTVGTITIRSYTAAKTWVHDETERLFCREAFEYGGAIHEQITPREGVKRSAPTGLSVLHHGYAQSPEDPSHKARRNIPILKRALAAYPNDEYFWFQLGKARYSIEEYAESVTALQRALACMQFREDGVVMGRLGPVSRDVLTDAVVTLAYALVNTKQIDAALHLIEEHAALNHAGVLWADFPHVQGYVHLMKGHLDAARAAYNTALAIGPEKEDVLGTGSFASLYHLGLLDEANENIDAAEACYLEAIAQRSDYAPALARLIDLVVEQDRSLPADVWTTVDRETFTAIYQDKLESTVRQRGAQSAQGLLKEAQRIAPELVDACRVRLKAMQEV